MCELSKRENAKRVIIRLPDINLFGVAKYKPDPIAWKTFLSDHPDYVVLVQGTESQITFQVRWLDDELQQHSVAQGTIVAPNIHSALINRVNKIIGEDIDTRYFNGTARLESGL